MTTTTITSEYSDPAENSSLSNSSDSSITEPVTSNYDDITLVKLLNRAKFSVFQGTSPKLNENFAIKFFPFHGNKPHPCFGNEIRFANLRHKNIMPILHYEAERDAAFDDGLQKISYTVMELAPYGDFYEVIMSQKVNIDEKLARTYFHQLMEGVEYLHSVGVAHLDLKLDNLLLGPGYRLKIGDFDQAYVKGEPTIYSRGTVCYRAPELAQRACKNVEAADIYSAGIILFLLMSNGTLPYSELDKGKGMELYSLLVNHPKKFWERHCKIQKKDNEFFSDDFRRLFGAMVRPNPKERPSIKQVKESKWYTGEIYSEEELVSLMKKHL